MSVDPLNSLERGARLCQRLLLRGSCSADEAASITGVGVTQAERDLLRLSRILPIYYLHRRKRWYVCREQLRQYQFSDEFSQKH